MLDKDQDETKTVMMCVRVSPSLYGKLKEAGNLERRTLSQMARILWEDALEARDKDKENTDDRETDPVWSRD